MAMEKEIATIDKYSTWQETSAPEGARFIDTKWVLKQKRDKKGQLLKYKVRVMDTR
jgi:hypothetical protein